MIPLVVGIFYVPDAWFPAHWKNAAACWLFVLAAITDAFDGYIARRYGMTSPLGAFLDPVADKLMSARRSWCCCRSAGWMSSSRS